jgi:alanine racemase
MTPFELPRRRALDHLIRPTRVEVSEAALRANLLTVRRLLGATQILAVVKANAYGHGAVQVARVLEDEGVDHFGVALVEEGLELRSAGIRGPILVMGGSYEGAYALMVEHRLTPTLFREEHVTGLAGAAKRAGVRASFHLKVDTGMSRLGVPVEDLDAFLGLLDALRPSLQLEGVLSHFANADLEGDHLTARQVQRFHGVLSQVRAAGFEPRWRHLANTAGVLGVPEAGRGVDVNLVRPGILLFGVAPGDWLREKAPLRPALSWKTGVIHLKTIAPGTAVSYGGTWVARRPSIIATLPVGYADGWGRMYSNRAHVLVRGRRAPIVGRVTMDMSMCDVTDVPSIEVGDEVVLLGSQGQERISAEELARAADTIPYEVLCSVGARVPRILVP